MGCASEGPPEGGPGLEELPWESPRGLGLFKAPDPSLLGAGVARVYFLWVRRPGPERSRWPFRGSSGLYPAHDLLFFSFQHDLLEPQQLA